MSMRTPFARPVFSVVFYVAGALTFLGYTLFGLGLLVGAGGMMPKGSQGLTGIFTISGLATVFIGAVGGTAIAAIGYVIELLAKIEWNTRPNPDGTGYAVESTRGPAGSSPDKQYYLSEKGRVTGPMNAAELLSLYRDGRISIAAQISVEENGQRRLLKNLSEIGL